MNISCNATHELILRFLALIKATEVNDSEKPLAMLTDLLTYTVVLFGLCTRSTKKQVKVKPITTVRTKRPMKMVSTGRLCINFTELSRMPTLPVDTKRLLKRFDFLICNRKTRNLNGAK